MSTLHFIAPVYQALDDDGTPLSGAKLYTYASGTSTPLATYTDSALTTLQANPVVADSAGRFGADGATAIFFQSAAYRLVLKTSDEVTVWEVDDFSPADIATSGFIKRDGTQAPTSNISWNGYKLTSLGDASDSGDAVSKGYLEGATWQLTAALQYEIAKPDLTGDFVSSTEHHTVAVFDNTTIGVVGGTGLLMQFQNYNANGDLRRCAFGARSGEFEVWAASYTYDTPFPVLKAYKVNGFTGALTPLRLNSVDGAYSTLGDTTLYNLPWHTAYVVNAVNVVSDERQKRQLEPIPDQTRIAFLEALRGLSFFKQDQQEKTFGFSAQEVRAALAGAGVDGPLTMITEGVKLPGRENEIGLLTFVSDEILPFLVDEINALRTRVTALENA